VKLLAVRKGSFSPLESNVLSTRVAGMVLVKVLWMYLIKPLCLLTVTCTDTGRDISAKVVMAIMEL
jgi:hypothetical protein